MPRCNTCCKLRGDVVPGPPRAMLRREMPRMKLAHVGERAESVLTSGMNDRPGAGPTSSRAAYQFCGDRLAAFENCWSGSPVNLRQPSFLFHLIDHKESQHKHPGEAKVIQRRHGVEICDIDGQEAFGYPRATLNGKPQLAGRTKLPPGLVRYDLHNCGSSSTRQPLFAAGRAVEENIVLAGR
jgi:hypothetical protein